MSILLLLIPLGLLLLTLAVMAFFWAVGSGQFDDLDTPAWSVIMDDDKAPPGPNKAPPGANKAPPGADKAADSLDTDH